MNNQEVWVYIEMMNGKIAEVSLELLNKGLDLSKQLNVDLGALVVGKELSSIPETLFRYGARKVYFAENSLLETYTTLPFAAAACQMIKKYQPQIVLYGATVNGRDIAPRIASELKVGLTADCTDLKIGEHKEYSDILFQIRPAFGGNIIATIISPEHRPQMATVREGVMKIGTGEFSDEGEVIIEKIELYDKDIQSEIIARTIHEKKVNLKGAQVIVAGGMGVGSKEGFQLIHKLAKVFNGVPAGSRAAVDAGFIGKEYQVGQTGTTVRPKLYIAVGISGQIQHIAGMNESNRIIAINNDPLAPIFQVSHYGIVDDYATVIPAIIEAYQELKK